MYSAAFTCLKLVRASFLDALLSFAYLLCKSKVIIEKFRGEVSLVGQDTIENVFFKFHIFLIHQNVPQIIETFLRYMMVS